jgi:hypothetical protein
MGNQSKLKTLNHAVCCVDAANHTSLFVKAKYKAIFKGSRYLFLKTKPKAQLFKNKTRLIIWWTGWQILRLGFGFCSYI